MAMRSKISLTKLAIALLEIPVSGWTRLRTESTVIRMIRHQLRSHGKEHTLVDVRRIRLLSNLSVFFSPSTGTSFVFFVALIPSVDLAGGHWGFPSG